MLIEVNKSIFVKGQMVTVGNSIEVDDSTASLLIASRHAKEVEKTQEVKLEAEEKPKRTRARKAK